MSCVLAGYVCQMPACSGLSASGPDTVQEFMWQEDLVSVAIFINACLNKVYAPAASPSHDG